MFCIQYFNKKVSLFSFNDLLIQIELDQESTNQKKILSLFPIGDEIGILENTENIHYHQDSQKIKIGSESLDKKESKRIKIENIGNYFINNSRI